MRVAVCIAVVVLLVAVSCLTFAGLEEEPVLTKDTVHLVTDLTVGRKVKTNPAWLGKPLSVVVDGLKLKQIVLLDDSGFTAPQIVLSVVIQRVIAHAAKFQLEQKPCDFQSGLDAIIVSEDNAYFRIQLSGKWGCISSTDGTGWFRWTAETHLLQPPPPNERDVNTFDFVVQIDENKKFSVADRAGDLPDLVRSLRLLGAESQSPILIQSHVSHRLYENAYSILTRAGFKQVAWNTYE